MNQKLEQTRDLIYDTKPVKQFPNGFTSWVETHHEIVAFITSFLLKADDPQNPLPLEGVIPQRRESQGTGGMYELAEEWTDEFETYNKGREWDGEFYDEIEAFCVRKNKEVY